MNNSAENVDSMSDITTEVDTGFSVPTAKPVWETLVVEPSVVGLPIESAPLEGTQPTSDKDPAAVEIGGTEGPEPTRL